MRILIVEDSEPIRTSLGHGLSRLGYAVDLAEDGEEGEKYALSNEFDLIILDIMLPGKNGLDVLRDIRSAKVSSHVLILSARDQVNDRIEGLNLGADDYLVKPFAFGELAARISALARRNIELTQPCLIIGPINIDQAAREVSAHNKLLALSPKEYSILEVLCLNSGRVYSRSQLLDKTSSFGHDASENSIDVLVHSIRQKLKRAGVENFLKTKRGFGYYIENE